MNTISWCIALHPPNPKSFPTHLRRTTSIIIIDDFHIFQLSSKNIGRNIVLSTKHGQQYQCSYRDKKMDDEREEQEQKLAKETGISELLKPLEEGPCLIAVSCFWNKTYGHPKRVQYCDSHCKTITIDNNDNDLHFILRSLAACLSQIKNIQFM